MFLFYLKHLSETFLILKNSERSCQNICRSSCKIHVFPPVALRPYAGHGLLILDVSRSHTTTHHNRYDFSERVISSSQGSQPDNTQHSQQTNIHAPGGIRTHDLSRRAAADLRLRPRGCWAPARQNNKTYLFIYSLILPFCNYPFLS